MLLRTTALFFAGFSLLNLGLDLVLPGFDANIWWVDFRLLPAPLPFFALILVALVLAAYVIGVPSGGPGRWFIVGGLGFLGLFLAQNVLQYYGLLYYGFIDTWFPVPLSLFLLLPVVFMLRQIRRSGENRPFRAANLRWKEISAIGRLWAAFALAVIAVLFPLLQMLCFGSTNYRRPADVAVVFGARAYADGRLSTALYDRIRTAVDLYNDGTVDRLILSGGPADGDMHETEAMRRYALRHGVKDRHILLDRNGLSTQATVDETVAMFREHDLRTVLAVSQFYHLPRIKLAYLRAGTEVYTVPAKQSRILRFLPVYMLREVAAFWYYYAAPVLVRLCTKCNT